MEGIGLQLRARDGRALQITQSDARAPRAVAVIAPGIGYPRRVYRHLAAHLANSGVTTITFDYRGLGEDRPKSYRGFHATLSDWARHDAGGALDHARSLGLPVIWVGHSFGGQLVGLVDDIETVAGAILIGSQLGPAHNYRGLHRAVITVGWHVTLPLFARTLGWLPAWAFCGEALPGGVAEEWARFGRAREFWVDLVPGARERLARFRAPLLSISAVDDPIAPPAAVEHLLSYLPHARRHVLERRCGHAGFFRPDAEHDVFREVLAFAHAPGRGPVSAVTPSFAVGWQPA